MNKEEIVSQIEKHTLRIAAKNLDCSYTNLRYWIKKHCIIIPSLHPYCNQCGEKLIQRASGGKSKKICDECKKEFIKIGYSRNGLNGLQKRLRRKAHIIKELGGKCSVCGYHKNIAALEFHHKNKDTKNFGLTGKNLNEKEFIQVKKELEKCIILCGNCHAEYHYPLYSNWKNINTFW